MQILACNHFIFKHKNVNGFNSKMKKISENLTPWNIVAEKLITLETIVLLSVLCEPIVSKMFVSLSTADS